MNYLPTVQTLACLLALLLCLGQAMPAVEIDDSIRRDPKLGINWLADSRSQEAWKSLFAPNPQWVTRELAVLATLHPEQVPTLWASRLLYRGDPWTHRDHEPSNTRRWRVTDRDAKLAILRDLRWRRDPIFIPVLGSFLASEENDAALANAALADLWLSSPTDGRNAAMLIANPALRECLSPARLPSSRMFALRLLLDTDGPATPGVRSALAWVLSQNSIPAERIAALSQIPNGAVPDLLSNCLIALVKRVGHGHMDDDSTTTAILCCSRLGDSINEETARTLAELATTAPRELACAAAATMARMISWKHIINPRPIAERLRSEKDPTVRHALMGALLRLEPKLLVSLPGADAWASLANHRMALDAWSWNQYMK
ncbi:MAG: hypothetical protein AAB263_13165 [Planctomycetota bacterium]